MWRVTFLNQKKMKYEINQILEIINSQCEHGEFIFEQKGKSVEFYFKNKADSQVYYILRKAVLDDDIKDWERRLYVEFIRDAIIYMLFAKSKHTVQSLIKNGITNEETIE